MKMCGEKQLPAAVAESQHVFRPGLIELKHIKKLPTAAGKAGRAELSLRMGHSQQNILSLLSYSESID